MKAPITLFFASGEKRIKEDDRELCTALKINVTWECCCVSVLILIYYRPCKRSISFDLRRNRYRNEWSESACEYGRLVGSSHLFLCVLHLKTVSRMCLQVVVGAVAGGGGGGGGGGSGAPAGAAAAAPAAEEKKAEKEEEKEVRIQGRGSRLRRFGG